MTIPMYPPPEVKIEVNVGGGGPYPLPGVKIEVCAGGGGLYPPLEVEIEVNVVSSSWGSKLR